MTVNTYILRKNKFRNIFCIKMFLSGNSLVVQWLGLLAFTAEGTGSIPGQGTKIPQDAWHGQKKKKFLSVEVEVDLICVHHSSWKSPFLRVS